MATFPAVITTSAPSSPAVYYTIVRGTAASPTSGTRTAMTARRTVNGTTVWEADITWDNEWVNPRWDFDDGVDVWCEGQVIANVVQGNGAHLRLSSTNAGAIVVAQYARGDITIRKGDSYGSTSGQTIDIVKPSGASWPSDLTGWTFTFTANKASNNSASGESTLSSTDTSATVLTGSTQTVRVNLTAAQTDGLATGQWVYDLQAASGLLRNTIISGNLRVLPEQTTT